MTIRDILERLALEENKDLEVLVFAEGKLYPVLQIEVGLKHPTTNEIVLELGCGWAEIEEAD